MLGIGESTVYTRMNKLIKAGVLGGFTADVDYIKLGLAVEAILEIKPRPAEIKRIEKYLASKESVLEILEVSGQYPIQVRLIARNNEELSRGIDEIAGIEGIAEINVKYVLRRVKRKNLANLLSKLIET